jgi:hypothetical protein
VRHNRATFSCHNPQNRIFLIFTPMNEQSVICNLLNYPIYDLIPSKWYSLSEAPPFVTNVPKCFGKMRFRTDRSGLQNQPMELISPLQRFSVLEIA